MLFVVCSSAYFFSFPHFYGALNFEKENVTVRSYCSLWTDGVPSFHWLAAYPVDIHPRWRRDMFTNLQMAKTRNRFSHILLIFISFFCYLQKIYSVPLAKSSKNLFKSPVAPSWNLHSVFIDKTRSIVVRDEFVHHNLQNNARQYDRAYRRLPEVLITYLPGRKVRELFKTSLGEQLVQLRPP